VKDFWLEFDISGVNSVDITEGRGAGECGVRDLGKLFVGVPHFLGLCVETGGVDIGNRPNMVLLSSGDSELELEEAVDLGHALKVLLADGDVLFEWFLASRACGRRREVHRIAVVFFVGNEEALEPLQPRLLAVIV
jgi:hypothetical protein